jgi:hypothetical protein
VEKAVVIEETPAEADKASPAPEYSASAEPDAPEPQGDAPTEEPPVASDKTPAATEERVRAGRSGGIVFAGFLLGGVVAAVIGFAAARYVVPDGWPFPGVPPEEDPVALAVEAQGSEIATLDDRLAALESDTSLAASVEDLSAQISGLGETISATTARLDALEERLAAVERLAPEGSAAAQMAAEAYERELAALREMFEGELEQVQAAQVDASELEAQAAESAQAAAGRAALARVTAALSTGEPFAEALEELALTTGVEAPEALATQADEGVPTLSELQESFPAAAREALDASVRDAVEQGEMSRFTAFMRTQLGTRSLEPQEGDDADAVLSRAEAALRQGELAAALGELNAMPEAGKPALADWRAAAQQRMAAVEASDALVEELNAN